MKKLILAASAVIALIGLSQPASAYNYTGNVDMLEIWFNGNIAFSLTPAVSTCNGQFILNESSAGTKNQYAALLAAKTKGVQVRVYGSDTCGSADGGGSNYNVVSYVYVLDN